MYMRFFSKYHCISFLNNYPGFNFTLCLCDYFINDCLQKHPVSGSMSRWLFFIFLAPSTVLYSSRYSINSFSLTQIFWKFLLWNYLQSLFPRNKRMAFLIFFEEHQSILVCLLFSSLFFAPRGSSPFPSLCSTAEATLAVTWHRCTDADLDPNEGAPRQAEGCR